MPLVKSSVTEPPAGTVERCATSQVSCAKAAVARAAHSNTGSNLGTDRESLDSCRI